MAKFKQYQQHIIKFIKERINFKIKYLIYIITVYNLYNFLHNRWIKIFTFHKLIN